MNERQIASLDDFSKYLRSLQFTLLATCIAFLAILLSERRSTIALADKQINEIYNYTLENNWNEQGVQQYLDKESENISLTTGSIQFTHGVNEAYILQSDNYGTAEFEFLHHNKYFKNLRSHDEINFDGSILRPESLNQFKQFFDAITTADGVYSVEGATSPVIHVEGYRQNNPIDESETESEIPIEEFSIAPKSLHDNPADADFQLFEANMEGEGQLVLKWTDGYSDDMGNVNEDFIYYTIPFEVNRERYRPIDLMLACSAFQGAESWVYASFEEQFKALDVVTKDWDDITITAAKKIINSEYARTGDTFQVVGIELPTQGLLSWGIFLVLAIQLYFYLHLREFLNRHELFSSIPEEVTVPWLVLYSGNWPVVVFYGTVVLLPIITAITVFIINLSVYPVSEVLRYLHILVAGLAMVVVSFLLGKEHRKIKEIFHRG